MIDGNANRNKIKSYLDEAKIVNYKINDDSSVDFKSDAIFSALLCKTLKKDIVANLGVLPFKIASVSGDLVLARMFLVSMINFPTAVGGSLDIASNKFRSLIHCPKKIGNNFICSGNKELKNLEHGPLTVGGDYDASGCDLYNCNDIASIHIKKDLRLSNNKLKSMPSSMVIDGSCYLSSNIFIDYPSLPNLVGMLIIESNPCCHADEYERETW